MDDYFNKIESILKQYNSINLSDIERIKLLKRIDTKFILNISDLPDILNKAKEHYQVLEIDDKRLFKYKTDYFDTIDKDMFTAHHDGKLNRYKIRKRQYIDANTSFLEVKKKTNKGVVIKERLKNGIENDEAFHNAEKFIEQHSPYAFKNLQHQFYSKFYRFTLLNNVVKEKITVDLDLSLQNKKRKEHFPFLAIVEIKQHKLNYQSLLFKLLKEERIQSISFSKYCMGTIMLNEEEKYNRFKKNLLTLKKIKNDS